MINTADFKTKTIFEERPNGSVEGMWGVALDIGYSSVKGFSPTLSYCFPSYARKINENMLAFGNPDKHEILYKDNDTGELWRVGSSAIDIIASDESRDSVASLYGRNRYFSPMFIVIARTGLGIGMMDNRYGSPNGKNLVVQTGLPPAYMKSDTPLIKEVLSGRHNFSVKIGKRAWQTFEFELPEDNIYVMPQPMGTLLSIATNREGYQVSEANNYFNSNMLILDPGFGTLDVFNIKNRLIDSYETFDDLGMKRVLQETVEEIFEKYHVEISVPAMQKYLGRGTITVTNRKERKTSEVLFGDILERANKKVCLEALQKIENIYNNLFDHKYLVITGGAGAAWDGIIRDQYLNMETLRIISGNQNDNTLPCIFSNVRGYYIYLLGKLTKMAMR